MMESEQRAVYEIRVGNSLESYWSSWFDGMSVEPKSPSVTALVGPVEDQPALYGLLDKIRDLGLVLLSVRRIDSI